MQEAVAKQKSRGIFHVHQNKIICVAQRNRAHPLYRTKTIFIANNDSVF